MLYVLWIDFIVLCNRQNTLNFESPVGKLTQEDSEASREIVLATFEVRGVEIVEFDVRDGFQCTSTGEAGTAFKDIDLSDEFCDYGMIIFAKKSYGNDLLCWRRRKG